MPGRDTNDVSVAVSADTPVKSDEGPQENVAPISDVSANAKVTQSESSTQPQGEEDQDVESIAVNDDREDIDITPDCDKLQQPVSLAAGFDVFSKAARGDTVHTKGGKVFKIPGTADPLDDLAKRGKKKSGGFAAYKTKTQASEGVSPSKELSDGAGENDETAPVSGSKSEEDKTADTILYLDGTKPASTAASTDSRSNSTSPHRQAKFVPSTNHQIRLGPLEPEAENDQEPDGADLVAPSVSDDTSKDTTGTDHVAAPGSIPTVAGSDDGGGKKKKPWWKRAASKMRKKILRKGNKLPQRRSISETPKKTKPSKHRKQRTQSDSRLQAIQGSPTSLDISVPVSDCPPTDDGASTGSGSKRLFGSVHRANPLFDEKNPTAESPTLPDHVEVDESNAAASPDEESAPGVSPVKITVQASDQDDGDVTAEGVAATPAPSETGSPSKDDAVSLTQDYTTADFNAIQHAPLLDSRPSLFRARLSTTQAKRKPTLGRRATGTKGANTRGTPATDASPPAPDDSADPPAATATGTAPATTAAADDSADAEEMAHPASVRIGVEDADEDADRGKGEEAGTPVADARARAQTTDGAGGVSRRRMLPQTPAGMAVEGGGVNRNRPMSKLLVANKAQHRASMSIASELNSILGGLGRGGPRGSPLGGGGRPNKALANFAAMAKLASKPSSESIVGLTQTQDATEEGSDAEENNHEAIDAGDEESGHTPSTPKRTLPGMATGGMALMSEINAKLGIKKVAMLPKKDDVASPNRIRNPLLASLDSGGESKGTPSEGGADTPTAPSPGEASGASPATTTALPPAPSTPTISRKFDDLPPPPPAPPVQSDASAPAGNSLAVPNGGAGLQREYTARTAAGIAFIEQQRQVHKRESLEDQPDASPNKTPSAPNRAAAGPGVASSDLPPSAVSSPSNATLDTLPRPSTALYAVGADSNGGLDIDAMAMRRGGKASKVRALRSKSKSASPDVADEDDEKARAKEAAEEIASLLEVENIVSVAKGSGRNNMSLLVEEEEPDEEDE